MKISIITASYNYEDYIKEAVDSVLNQTYQDWEMIIVDDGSSDNSIDVINSYIQNDSRIKLFTHENNENKGLSKTVELGVSKAEGEYIAFLESDDIWAPDYLAKKVGIITRYPDISFIFNDIEMFGDEKSMKEYDKYFLLSRKILSKINFPSNIFNWLLLLNLCATFSCAMVKSEVLKNCNFDVSYKPWLDLGIWLQIAYQNDAFYIPEKLTKWRMHQRSYINTSNKSKRDNNKIILSFVGNIFENEKNPFKKFILIKYYSLLMILIKLLKGFIKKILLYLL